MAASTRRLVYASAGVLLLAGVACFLASSAEWASSATLVDPLPGEAAEQAGFVLDMCAIGALNLLAALVVVLLRRELVWWLVVGLQAAVFVAALIEGWLTDPPGWFAFSSLPLATLVVLVGLRVLSAKTKPSLAASRRPHYD